LFVDVPADLIVDQLTDPAWVWAGPQTIGAHSGGSTGSVDPGASLLILRAVNPIAALLGTADRSTNIELVTCVNSGFCAVSLLPGATDLLPDEEQETVITTMHAAAVTANSLR
jgi:hypothetical protein